MRCLVTGAFGAIGGRVAEGLQLRGHTVLLHGRAPRPNRDSWANGRDLRYCDLTAIDVELARRLVDGCEAVIHLASLDEHEAAIDPEAAMAVSGAATRALLRGCESAGVKRFVFASTLYVYGSLPEGVIDEATPTNAEHPYARAHLAGESFCTEARARGVETVSARLSNVYGAPAREAAARYSTAHAGFCRGAVREGAITLRSSGEDLRDFVSVEDVAQAFDLLLRADVVPPVCLLGSGTARSVLSVAESVQSVYRSYLGRDIPIRRASDTGLPRPTFELSLARLRELGYEPHDSVEQETMRFLEMLQHG